MPDSNNILLIPEGWHVPYAMSHSYSSMQHHLALPEPSDSLKGNGMLVDISCNECQHILATHGTSSGE